MEQNPEAFPCWRWLGGAVEGYWNGYEWWYHPLSWKMHDIWPPHIDHLHPFANLEKMELQKSQCFFHGKPSSSVAGRTHHEHRGRQSSHPLLHEFSRQFPVVAAQCGDALSHLALHGRFLSTEKNWLVSTPAPQTHRFMGNVSCLVSKM